MKTLYGLVLAGGRSSRMNKDKAALNFHGITQVEYCYGLLALLAEKVFVSNRPDQQQDLLQKKFPQIHDEPHFVGAGPLAGILSAQHKYPEAAWLVLACDLPFVDRNTLDFLIAQRDPQKLATAFTSAHDKLPEPLCAIYEAHSAKALLSYLMDGQKCPRKFMIKHDVKLLELPDKMALDNINTPEELATAQEYLKSKK